MYEVEVLAAKYKAGLGTAIQYGVAGFRLWPVEETYQVALLTKEEMRRLYTMCKPALSPSVPAPKSALQQLKALDKSKPTCFKCGDKGHIARLADTIEELHLCQS